MSLPPSFVNISVNLPAVGITPQSFNTGMIIGSSAVISTGNRVATYASLAAMVTAGFATNAPEYLAAAKYFGANPAPSQVVIGRAASGETPLQAIQACLAKSPAIYGIYHTGAVDADQAAVAAYIETLSPFMQYFLNTSTAGVASGTGGTLFLTLSGSTYKRTHGVYSATAHRAAAVMGYAMGAASNARNSNFTLDLKQLVGETVDTLTLTQVGNIETAKGNVYINRGVDMYEKGTNFSGDFFDQILGLDMLASGIQTNAINVLYQNASIPQTEDGMAVLRSEVAQACQVAVNRGFLAAGGTWNGATILNLAKGTVLPDGYMIQSDPIASQSQSDRDNRIAPNIYACVKLAGSLQSVAITVNVNR